MGHLTDLESDKYLTAWSLPEYRKVSPGKVWAETFCSITGCRAGETVLDAGCGAGEGGREIARLTGATVTYLDLVLVQGVPRPFLQQALWERIRIELVKPSISDWDYAFCCDVMEHIPQEMSMLVVHNLLEVCRRVFFSISFLPDRLGRMVGKPLHLNVQNFVWWRDRLREMGTLLEARDCLGEGVFYVEAK